MWNHSIGSVDPALDVDSIRVFKRPQDDARAFTREEVDGRVVCVDCPDETFTARAAVYLASGTRLEQFYLWVFGEGVKMLFGHSFV